METKKQIAIDKKALIKKLELKSIFPNHLVPREVWFNEEGENKQTSSQELSPEVFSEKIGYSYVENIFCPKGLRIPPEKLLIKDEKLRDFIFKKWSTINASLEVFKITKTEMGLRARRKFEAGEIVCICTGIYSKVEGKLPKKLKYHRHGHALPAIGLLENTKVKKNKKVELVFFAEEVKENHPVGGYADAEFLPGLWTMIKHAYANTEQEKKKVNEDFFFPNEQPLYANLKPECTVIYNESTGEKLPVLYFITTCVVNVHEQFFYPFFLAGKKKEKKFFGDQQLPFFGKDQKFFQPGRHYIDLKTVIPSKRTGFKKDVYISYSKILAGFLDGKLILEGENSTGESAQYLLTKNGLKAMLDELEPDFLYLLSKYFVKEGLEIENNNQDHWEAIRYFLRAKQILMILGEKGKPTLKESAEVHWNLGITYGKLGDIESGIRTITQAIYFQLLRCNMVLQNESEQGPLSKEILSEINAVKSYVEYIVKIFDGYQLTQKTNPNGFQAENSKLTLQTINLCEALKKVMIETASYSGAELLLIISAIFKITAIFLTLLGQQVKKEESNAKILNATK